MDKIKLVGGLSEKQGLPAFRVGDTLKVFVKIPEGDKFRIHVFEGAVIEKRGEGMSSTFTLRKISYGEGIERTFPLHSPTIDSVEVVKRGNVKRARLYYLRDRVGKATKIEEGKSMEAASKTSQAA